MKFRKSNSNTEQTKPEADLHKLNRLELLEMLIEQGRETEALRQRVKELETQLEARTICINEAGNIAEAALALNHVMEDAQAAAQQYLDNVQQLCDRIQQETIQKCTAMEQETKDRCTAMEQDAGNHCKSTEQNPSGES